MFRRSASVLLLASALLSIAAPPALAAWPHDPNANLPVATGPGNRLNPSATEDGSGGAFIVWADSRSGTSRIFAQHILADATIAPGWVANGNQVKTVAVVEPQTVPVCVNDGAGGVIIAWVEPVSVSSHAIFAQRLTASGSPLWGASGITLTISVNDQLTPQVVADPAGNAIFTWVENHSGDGVPTGFDVYAQRVAPNGTTRWGSAGVAICKVTGDQTKPALVADGKSGADFAWLDGRSGLHGIYGERRDSTGAVVGSWVSSGSLLTQGSYNVVAPLVVGNTTGGMLVVWTDDRNGGSTEDVFATNVTGDGSIFYGAGGAAVCTAGGIAQSLQVCSDSADGAFIAWTDSRPGGNGVYAQRVISAATIATGWPAINTDLPILISQNTAPQTTTAKSIVPDGVGGFLVAMEANVNFEDVFLSHLTSSGVNAEGWSGAVTVSSAIGNQTFPVCVSDGASGAIVAFIDDRNSLIELFAQRIDKWGVLGNAEPTIASVTDVPNDQGGFVRIDWNPSYLDAYPTYGVSFYEVFRHVPTLEALADLRAGRARLLGGGEAPGARPGRALRERTDGGTTSYWEFVSVASADALPGYSAVVATTSDSLPGSNPLTAFMVEAHAGNGHPTWDSAPLSGYSVDNLAPPAPAPFTASYAAGVTHLQWTAPGVSDVASYRLYRGSSPGFVPLPANLLVQTSALTFADSPGGFYDYKVSAVDVHGNEGPTVLAFPTSTTAVAGGASFPLALAGAEPNPLHADGTIRWTQPRTEHVRVMLVDLSGRHVRTIADGEEPAGAHTVRWNAHDDAGRAVADGVYFLELEAEGRTLETRVAVLR